MDASKLKVVVDISGKLIKVVTASLSVEGGNVMSVVVSAVLSRSNSSNLNVVVVIVGLASSSVMPSRTSGVVRSLSNGSTGLSSSTVSNCGVVLVKRIVVSTVVVIEPSGRSVSPPSTDSVVVVVVDELVGKSAVVVVDSRLGKMERVIDSRSNMQL